MGFGAGDATGRRADAEEVELLQSVQPEDLLAYGFIPEFIGRLPVVSVLAELTEPQLIRILTEPRNALVKQFAKLLSYDGAELTFTPDAIQELAARALEKGTGARALRAMMERLMRDVMFDIPGSDDIGGVTVSRAVVRGEAAPLIRRKARQAAA